MHEFYNKAIIASICLCVISALLAYACISASHLETPLLPARDSRIPWQAGVRTDAEQGGTSAVRIHEAGRRLRFDLRLSDSAPYPFAAAELLLEDRQGKPILADLSAYGAMSFFVRCAPANTLTLNIPTFDDKVTVRDKPVTYRTPVAFFSCDEKGSTVEIDLAHMETPQWWFDMFKLSLSKQHYKLDKVPRIAIGSTFQSPQHMEAQVEIADLVLKGRNDSYLFLLGFVLFPGWSAFGIWFFRAHSRALIADMNARMKKDLPLVAYQQLSLEPHKDKEKSAVLRFIATNYTNPDLDLETVVNETGANRNKVNEVIKAELGFTFSGYLNKLRLTEAARLLNESGTATVAEIAFSVGYNNVSYFNKLFKEEYGCTPNSFRKASTRQAAA